MRTFSVLGVFAVTVALAAPTQAGPITGSSSGSFNDVQNCNGLENCAVSGGGTVLTYGLVGSSLQTQAVVINTSTPANDVDIARLVWTQNLGDIFLPSFDFDWATSFVFTNPVGSTSKEFDMSLTTTLIGADTVGIDLTDLTGLSGLLANLLPGVQISDVKFRTTNSTLSGNTWINNENQAANLFITADFNSTLQPVPEPASMLLLGTGLAGVVARRRLSRKNEAARSSI